ncbi:MAG: hypothetical protein O8C60_05880 [Candidatus Methanoperedens sp.]|nr:hypothetical protein [Candidatus Methanoperedens sp.]
MYVKDSIIEARIEKDLKKQHLKGSITEIEHQLKSVENCLNSGLRERLNRLREELDLLSD